MAKKQTRKPAARKAATRGKTGSGGNGGIARIGWMAAVAVAGAWAVSNNLGGAGDALENGTEKVKRVVAAVMPAEPARVAATERAARPVRERESQPAPTTTGSIPTPQKRAVAEPADEVRRLIAAARPPAPVPQAAPMLPFAKPPVEATLRESAPRMSAPPPTMEPTPRNGERRHATRQLAAYAAPDGNSRKLAEIEAASSVFVLRAAGGWRLVRDTRSGTEGWVDGRYLAGEHASADLVSLGAGAVR